MVESTDSRLAAEVIACTVLSGVCVLLWTLPGRHFYHSHDTTQSLLHYQPHLSLSTDLRRVVPRFLPAGGVWRESQPRDHDSASTGRLSADCWGDPAANARRHSRPRSVYHVFELRSVTCHVGSHGVTSHRTHVNAARINHKFTTRQAGAQLAYPGGMEGWVALCAWLYTVSPW